MTLRVPWRTSESSRRTTRERTTRGVLREAGDCTGRAGQGPHVQLTQGALSRESLERQARDVGGPPETPGEPPPTPLALRNLLTSQHHHRCAGRPRWLHGTRRPQSSARPCLQKESTVSPGQGGQPGPGSGVRREPGRATVGIADTAFSEPSEAGAPNECPMPTATCPARAQVQHPRGTEDGGTVAQVTNSISPTLQRKMPAGGGQAARCGLLLGITGRGPRAGNQTGLCREIGTRTEAGTEPHHCPRTC